MTEFKKFLLFIVEGLNDKREIETIIKSFCKGPMDEKKYVPWFVPPKGDITSKDSINEKNILPKIERMILDFRNEGIPYQRIKASDIAAVIHIVDTDGVYIPNDHVVEEDVGNFAYHDTTIGCMPRDKGIQRNSRKAKVLNKLIRQKEIGGIPYSLYFASCNMDHLLYGDRNPPQGRKDIFAKSFGIKILRQGLKYHDIFPDEVIVKGNYEETWAYISEKGTTHSLDRLTNLDLLFRNTIGLTSESKEAQH